MIPIAVKLGLAMNTKPAAPPPSPPPPPEPVGMHPLGDGAIRSAELGSYRTVQIAPIATGHELGLGVAGRF